MAITVKQLVDTPHLRTCFYAGRAGGEQVINWAHTCEMPDPWHWLEPFDMLMTNGLGMPEDAADRGRYVSLLADAGISAIAIGEDVGAPPISAAMAHLMRVADKDSVTLALIPGDQASLGILLDTLPDGCSVGCSAGIAEPQRVPDAAREARWALHRGTPDGSRVIRYEAGNVSSWAFALERSEELAEHVLGALLRYDRTHQTELVRTLAVLLANNRSPTRTAAELFIHRQTLVYRIRRIESLTGRSLSSTKDVVDLWLALRALEVVEGSSLLGGGA